MTAATLVGWGTGSARHARPQLSPRHVGRTVTPVKGPRHVGTTVSAPREKASIRTIMRRLELVILVVVGVPLLFLILPTTVGGRAGWTIVVGQSMEPTIYPGDLVLTRSQSEYAIGDVIVYKIPEGRPGAGVMVIHRITGGSEAEGFVTTGDNREFADPWHPTSREIVGSHWRTVPKGGYVIVWMRSPLAIAVVMSLAVYGLTLQFLAASAAQPAHPRHARPSTVPAYA